MKTQKSTLIIATGGTLDSYFDPKVDTVRPLSETVMKEYLKNMNADFGHEIVTICMKDSREITDNDRKQMAEVIRKSECAHVVITHGTFTMADTAEYLKKKGLGKKQSIVLTGSFVPLKQFSGFSSDAPFNIGYAIGCAHIHTSGIYIAMQGNLFPAGKVMKNIAMARFEAKNN